MTHTDPSSHANGQRHHRLRAWLGALRPATLSLSLAPVFVGTALAYAHGRGRVGPAAAAALSALLIQIGTNLHNDYCDFARGADTPLRLGPARATQRGWLSAQAVLSGCVAAFIGAALCGLYLVWVGGWPIVAIGLSSILSAISYTAGPRPLAYTGAADPFVFVFFGPVAVGGTYWVQAGQLPAEPLLAGCCLGALSTAVLVVNNLRDRNTDVAAGKRTLAVRFGARFARAEYIALVAAAYGIPAVAALSGAVPRGWLLPLSSAPLCLAQVRGVLREDGAQLNRRLAATARATALFGALLGIGVLL